jgi:hypothetical protein
MEEVTGSNPVRSTTEIAPAPAGDILCELMVDSNRGKGVGETGFDVSSAERSFPVVEESKPQGVEESRLVRDDRFHIRYGPPKNNARFCGWYFLFRVIM